MRTPTYAHGQTRHERAPKKEARQLTAEDPQVPEEQQAEARHLPGSGRFPRAAADNHRGGTPAAAGRGARPGRRGTERNGAERGGGPVRPRLRRPPRGCGAPRSPRSSSAERGPEGRCRPIGGSPRRDRSRRRRGGRWGAGGGCWRRVPKFSALRRSAFPRCSVQPGGSRARLLGPPRLRAFRGDPGPPSRPSGPELCPLVSSPWPYVRVYM